MSMTLWVHVLEGRTLSKDNTDHYYLTKLSGELDELCKSLGFEGFYKFIDDTDFKSNLDVGFDEEDSESDSDDEVELDLDTGWSYGIDDMQWFEATAGLSVLRGLAGAIDTGALAELDADQRQELLQELGHCISLIEGPAQRGGKFHLAMVM